MRGCLLKCSGEQVRKATDAEWLGAELSRTLATESLNSRQRSGQRGYVDVDVEPEGQPIEEPQLTPDQTCIKSWARMSQRQSTRLDP